MPAASLLRSAQAKQYLVNPLQQLERIDLFFREEFGITLKPWGADVFSEIRTACGDETGDLYEELNQIRAEGSRRAQARAEEAFYDLISQQPLTGIVHSEKWCYLVEAAAFLSALVQLGRLTGQFLDYACHVGYHAIWLAREHGLSGVGIDRSHPAIEAASRFGEALGVSDRARFQQATSPMTDRGEQFVLVYTIDGPASPTEEWLRRLARPLHNDGILVMIGVWPELRAQKLRKDLTRVGLDLLIADVIGGWDGQQYGANTVLVLAKGSGLQPWQDVWEEAQRSWSLGFQAYCNTPSRDPRDKLLSKYRLARTLSAFTP